MLFNFPYSYSYQDGAIVGNILRGSLILWTSVLALIKEKCTLEPKEVSYDDFFKNN